MTIHFGEAFKLNYERLRGPGKGEQHLPQNDLDRELKEFELEQQAGDRLAININVATRLPAQVIQTNQGSYLLTDGPKQNSLSEYQQLATSLRPAETFEDVFINQKAEAHILENADELTLQYSVNKNTKTGTVFPLLKNLNPLKEAIRERLFSKPGAKNP